MHTCIYSGGEPNCQSMHLDYAATYCYTQILQFLHELSMSQFNGVAEFNCTGVCKDLIWMDNGHQLHDGDNGHRVNITHAIPVNL